jgi:hypothetical protein
MSLFAMSSAVLWMRYRKEVSLQELSKNPFGSNFAHGRTLSYINQNHLHPLHLPVLFFPN